MTSKKNDRETRRLSLQSELDSQKKSGERNKMGQFATPPQLARDVLRYGLALLPHSDPIRFLDPAIGTGSFYSALEETRGQRKVTWARGFEIDPHYGDPARALWKGTALEMMLADFTKRPFPARERDKANLLICNPPYVRHHHMSGEEKSRLSALTRDHANLRLSGLAGLYCYFMALAQSWMAPNGVAGWLIPSEFMDVNYGRALKQYLLSEVTLLHIHRFDPNDVQFDDALVSSAVVWLVNKKPPPDHKVRFTFGGSLEKPTTSKALGVRELANADKWTRFPKHDVEADHEGYRLGDLFSIKRGLATGDNTFFIVTEDKAEALRLPKQFLRPVLPSTRHIKSDEVLADDDGLPLLDRRLFLIDCDLPESELKRDHPSLWAYLKTGMEKVSDRYLCRTRRHWYTQEKRPAAPIICTYLGRSDHNGKPFRFLLNHSRATATNVYLMLYPKPPMEKHLSRHPNAIRSVWLALNEITPETLLHNGRVYGGGLHKLEPRELANVPVDSLADQIGLAPKQIAIQLDLAEGA